MFVFVVCGPPAGTDNNCGYVDIDGNRQFDWTYALVVHDMWEILDLFTSISIKFVALQVIAWL